MSNTHILQEIRGIMTQFEPLTAESLEKAVSEDITFSEFESLMQSYGLSMEFIVHDPTRQCLNTFYADFQHGRYVELYLNPQYLREVLPAIVQHLPKEGEYNQDLINGNWTGYYLKHVPLPLQIYDFQKRYQTIPTELVFQVWYQIHKRIDYSNQMWQPDVLEYVFSYAPATELPDADTDGLIKIYRGMGALSQPPERAISWSSHPGNALWFANHSARGTCVAVAKVRPDQIVHYSPTFYNENEVIVRPGTITEYDYEDMIPAKEDTVPQLMVPAVPDFLQFGRIALSLGYPQEMMPLQVHGIMHILRVLLLSLIYFHNSGDQLTEEDKHILIFFSLLHDLGRTSEDCDDAHGDASVNLIHSKGIRLKGIRMSKKDYIIAELIIRYHCRNDQVGLTAIQNQHNFSHKDKERAKHLYLICKDMDGLDRVRFNGLDYRMLRTEYACKLPLVAGCLLEERLLEVF